MVDAPRETVLDVYADYRGWPGLFPTISGVRLLRREGAKLVLEVDHVEGKVLNELVVRPPDAIDLWRLQLQPVKAEAEAWTRHPAAGRTREGGA
jgi:hypothetical protein